MPRSTNEAFTTLRFIEAVTLRSFLQPDASWLDEPGSRRVWQTAMVTVIGLAFYGFTVGWWRSPLMAGYVAVKMPLLVALTLGCNGLLNGLLALLLGTGLGIRQSFLALLMATAVSALILGSLAPVTFFLAWNAPVPGTPEADTAYAAYQVIHTFLIGFAGVVANSHLYRLLAARAPTRAAARATLIAWLAGNGFLGAQFSWVLRPFFGLPGMEVEFLRPQPLKGNFYETIWGSLVHIAGDGFTAGIWLTLAIIVIGVPVFSAFRTQPSN
ncbi:hypothetical protein KBB96_18945 [Luteolibacter ambystomatis]|uniref:Uncharacterized protein n=1 Tax=Luteolibacter ambystomatis TaxID=2824561 RepID=A0A975IZH4_9BACT|nr:hypothetical protein [Luteolibacter ambystomatis]QUE50923.1 hypothetical protein KBB96_18945 [Luteolibacter ambystomatis]